MKSINPSNLINKLMLSAVLFGVATVSAGAAGLVYDLRATGVTGGTLDSAKSVSVGIGSTVNFSLYAVITGTTGNVVADEGYQSGLIAMQTFVNSGPKNVKANYTAQAFGAQWGDSGSTLGTLQDLNGDGDIDIGSTVSNNSAGYFVPRAAGVVFSGAGVTVLGGNPSQTQFLVATFSITVTSILDLNSAVPTFANVKWGILDAGRGAARASFKVDNSATNKNYNSPGFLGSVGSDVAIIAAVPEPSAFGMILTGALGLIGFRRLGFRRS
jgi:hypothetical protein